MITERDSEVIKFLSRFRVATTDILTSRFFVSTRTAQKRLTLLCKWGEIQRIRPYSHSQYVYYLGEKPKQVRHSLLITEFYHHFPHKIHVFEPEYTVGRIRADAILGFERNGVNEIAFLEVQISRNLDLNKYRRFFISGEYSDHFPQMPKIYVVTDLAFFPPPELSVVSLPTTLKKVPRNRF